MDNTYMVGSNHVLLVRILTNPNFKALMKITWRILQLENDSKEKRL